MMTDREKAAAGSQQAQKQFDQVVRESCERIQAAKEREEEWEEKAERVIQAAKKIIGVIIDTCKRVWRNILDWIRSFKKIQPEQPKADRLHHHKIIQQEHQDQARMVVSIREHMQHKQLAHQRMRGVRKQ